MRETIEFVINELQKKIPLESYVDIDNDFGVHMNTQSRVVLPNGTEIIQQNTLYHLKGDCDSHVLIYSKNPLTPPNSPLQFFKRDPIFFLSKDNDGILQNSVNYLPTMCHYTHMLHKMIETIPGLKRQDSSQYMANKEIMKRIYDCLTTKCSQYQHQPYMRISTRFSN